MKKIKLWAIIALAFASCKKDNTIAVTFTTDRSCNIDNQATSIYPDFTCAAGPTTIMVERGKSISYEVYSNCSGTPKKEAHLIVTKKDGRKEKVIYDSNGILHEVSAVID